jgi:hypothetical protein
MWLGREAEVFVSRGGYGVGVGCSAPDGTPTGGPLLALSSSQTLTVDVVIGTYKLGLLPRLANPVPKDTTITFIETNDGDTQDDFKKDSWLWTPADGSPPVELWLNGCGFTCRFKVTKSGTMTLSGTVGGFLDGHRERVSASSAVIVGQSVPSLTLRADRTDIVLGDTVVLTTESAEPFTVSGYAGPGGGGPILASKIAAGPSLAASELMDTSVVPRAPSASMSLVPNGTPACGPTVTATSCFAVPDVSGEWVVNAMVRGQPIQAKVSVPVKIPRLSIECKQDSPTRLAFVTCSAQIDVPRPFKMTRRKSTTDEQTLVDEPLQAIVNSGEVYPWRGRQAADTKVTMWVEVGGKPLAPATGQFAVAPRTGPEWAPIDNMPIVPPTPERAMGPPKLKAHYPGYYSLLNEQRNYRWASGALGQAFLPAPSMPPVDYVTSGPNRGIAYFTSGLRLTDPEAHIYVTAALFPDDKFWMAQRGGTTSDGHRYCDSDDMGAMRLTVYHHEKGHYRNHRKLLQSPEAQARVEATVQVIALDADGTPSSGTSEMTSLERFREEQFGVVFGEEISGTANDQTHSDDEYKPAAPQCYLRFQGDSK